jgi:peptide/nickel transport system permease protein
MQRFIVRRLLQGLVTLFLVSIIVFILGRMTGDPVALLLSEFSTFEDKERLARQLGLDKPLVEQYAIFVWNAIRGDLGRSIRGDHAPALKLVLDRFPATLQLAATSSSLSFLVGLPLGVLAALKRGSFVDTLSRILALLGQATPVFWLGIAAMYVFSVRLGWLPTSGYGTPKQFVLPVFSLSAFMVAAFLRLTRSGMMEALDSEYVP